MRKLVLLPVFLIFVLQLQAQETLLLRHPSISNNKIAFAYGSDIWTVNRDGSNAQRLTINPDVEYNPCISPDGQWVAFSGNYDGNIDVYVVSINGGSPKRLTFHPGVDVVRGWSGNKVMYASTKESATPRYQRLFLADAATGQDEVMKMPEATEGSVSPDGKYTAYIKVNDPSDGNRNYRPFKLYRGGLMPRVWIFNNANYEVEEIPGSKGNNNIRPIWVGNQIYFLSDRDNHNVNIYSYNTQSKEVKKLTDYKDYDVKTLNSDGKDLVFEQAGRIHLMNLSGGKVSDLSIALNADLTTKRPHWENGENTIRDGAISPTGVRAVFETRGDIVTVPLEKGDIRNITHSPGVNDRSPAWSPDGRYIAYFNDDGGEYKLKIKDQKGDKEETTINLDEGNFYYRPVWSPDSKKISYSDKHMRLYYVDVNEKKPVFIDQDLFDRPDAFFGASWSPDNNWIVYNRKLKNNLRAIFVYDVANKKTHQLTDGTSEAASPTFSRDGKYIFFTASTNYGRSVGWLDMSSYENPVRNSIYAIVLTKETPSPLSLESDEEMVKGGDTTAKTSNTGTARNVRIDFDDIDQRIVALPLPEKNYSNLQGWADGKLFFLQREAGGGPSSLMVYDIVKRKTDTHMAGVTNFALSADGKKILYNLNNAYYLVSSATKPNGTDGKLNLTDLKIWSDPEKEWAQMFREVWRIERDFFYVENLHGADWKAIKTKYEKFLPYVSHREDLSYLFNDMMSELVIGHNYVNQGDYPDPVNVNVGLLGADYEMVNGKYRFKKIYSGLNWNPGFLAPLTQPGVNVEEGDYILSVNGVPVDASNNIYSVLQNTAGKQTRILVNKKPSMDGAREYTVVPVASEANLRLMNWVEGNRKKVSDLSGGRLAYVYLPNTGGDGYTFFNRYYFSQLDKDGVILDERFNGGGSAADYIIDMLNRKVSNYWKNRDGDIMKTPEAVIDGPMAMVTNGYAGSGGDLMPYLFRQKKLGPLVGTTTHGILVGIYNYPVLMDGGTVTAPRLGIFSTDGKWIIENEGVAPDVEVEQTPKEVINGKDPQLEKAVDLVFKQLGPKKEIKAPPPPVRAVKGKTY
jgi:tricorn protease